MAGKLLSVGMVGEDVATLHQALSARGFSVPDAETARRFFGAATREAVRKCQALSGLKVTGEVEESTASLLGTPSRPAPATAITPDAVGRVAGAAGPPRSEFERRLRATEADTGGASARADIGAAGKSNEPKPEAPREPAFGSVPALVNVLGTIPRNEQP